MWSKKWLWQPRPLRKLLRRLPNRRRLGRAPSRTSATRSSRSHSLAIQKRIIIYTVDMTLEIVDVATSVDEVGAMAREMGGWIVSTSRAERHLGFISVRVPAERLDEAVARLREMAVDVQAENASSRDVTDEYVDLTSRLGNLEATETALLRLFDRAATVEEALDVQRTLSQVQGEIEVIKGRINFLEQTSAFSLINVTLVLEPQSMEIDAGGDQIAGRDQPVKFRASFKPPEGIDRFSFVWDFGDGSGPFYSDRTAPTADADTRVTAPVTHVYYDVENSPYFRRDHDHRHRRLRCGRSQGLGRRNRQRDSGHYRVRRHGENRRRG